jgi:hypothetical protein
MPPQMALTAPSNGSIKWVNGITRLNLEVIGKLRHDANLQYLYEGLQKPRDRRRIHDGDRMAFVTSTYLLNQLIRSINVVKREMNRNSTFISMLH